MANQRDKEHPRRALAEQPTHPVDLDGVGPSSRGEAAGEGPTISVPEARPARGPSRGSRAPSWSQSRRLAGGVPGAQSDDDSFGPPGRARASSRTQSGLLGPAPHQEPTASLAEADVALIEPSHAPALAGGLARSDEEPTKALDPVELRPTRLDPTADLSWPDPSLQGPAEDELVGARYRVVGYLSEGGGTRLHQARAPDGRAVVVRTFIEPRVVQSRPAWHRLREAFEEGSPLPDLFAIEGVVPVIDFVEDAKHGPAVVTADLGGGTLADRAAEMSPQALRECFERVVGVVVEAHALGVTFGRLAAEDVWLDPAGAPHLDLTAPAFADALDVRDGQDGPMDEGEPSPSVDVWWIGRTIQACLPRDELGPGYDALAALAQDCLRAPRPSAGAVLRRLEAARSRPKGPPGARWPAAAMLLAGTLAALAAGWIAGGGLTSSPSTAPSAPSRASDDALARAEAALAAGAWLEAGQIYRRLLTETDDPRARRAWDELQGHRSFRRALKDLKKRLASADRVTPAVRRDVEMLRVLEPQSLVLKHWLGRLAEDPRGVP